MLICATKLNNNDLLPAGLDNVPNLQLIMDETVCIGVVE